MSDTTPEKSEKKKATARTKKSAEPAASEVIASAAISAARPAEAQEAPPTAKSATKHAASMTQPETSPAKPEPVASEGKETAAKATVKRGKVKVEEPTAAAPKPVDLHSSVAAAPPAAAPPAPVAEEEPPLPAAGFRALGLGEPAMRAIIDAGFEAPTPIQEQAIPFLLQGRDLIGQAQTGTGKTAAFALPLAERLDATQNHVQAIVLLPTLELCIQVAQESHNLTKYCRLRVLPIYGGQPIDRQLRALSMGAHVVVGTPGRVLDHLRRGTLKLDRIRVVILDEADEMLNMGFLEDVEEILKSAPADRQTALFSATMPPRIATTSRQVRRR